MPVRKTPTLTLRYAAKSAIGAQNAVSISGVTASYSEICSEVLWPIARQQGQGTEWVNRHPISKLFAYKIKALSGLECLCDSCAQDYREANERCDVLARSKVNVLTAA